MKFSLLSAWMPDGGNEGKFVVMYDVVAVVTRESGCCCGVEFGVARCGDGHRCEH